MTIPNSGILVLSPSGYPGNGAQLDLTQYLDVQAGDGLDPANATFTEHVFSHALLKEGGVLALENLQLKELRFPLYLSASSRDGVSTLLTQINTMVNAPGQTLLWQDQGSTQPTYFDVASGQADVTYDFRRAGGRYLHVMLRMFVQPMGHTATMRLVASAVSTGPLMTMGVPSPILGDANALMQATVSIPSADLISQSGLTQVAGVSILPFGYQPEFQANQMQATLVFATKVGGSGAVGSLFIRQLGVGGSSGRQQYTFGTIPLPIGTPYYGLNRMLAVARASSSQASAINLFTQTDQYTGAGLLGQQVYTPTMSFPGNNNAVSEWALYDLGTLPVPSSVSAATMILMFRVGFGAQPSGAPTPILDITDLILLPDSHTSLVATGLLTAAGNAIFFDGIQGETTMWKAGVISGRTTGVQRGAIPKVPVIPSSQIAVISSPDGGAANQQIQASVKVRERVRFTF